MNETLPIYSWDPWPEGMFTARQLREKGLVPGAVAGLIPYSKSRDGDGYLRVYRLDEATPKPPLTEAQKVAVDRMQAGKIAKRTCQYCGKVEPEQMFLYSERACCKCGVQRWARALLECYANDLVVLDTETTGIYGDSEIVAISVIDAQGNVLLDTYVKPQSPIIEAEYEGYDEDDWRHRKYGPRLTAFGVNRISNAMVASAPAWQEVVERLRPLLAGKVVLIYNEEFDHRMLDSNCERHNIPQLEAEGWECLMLEFAAWAGDWSDYHGDWRYQTLGTAASALRVQIGGAHTAAGDCFTALGVLKALAAAPEQGKESR